MPFTSSTDREGIKSRWRRLRSILGFGKHKGKLLSEVEPGYLIWLEENTEHLLHGGRDWTNLAIEELERRKEGRPLSDGINYSEDFPLVKESGSKQKIFQVPISAAEEASKTLLKEFILRPDKDQGIIEWTRNFIREAWNYGEEAQIIVDGGWVRKVVVGLKASAESTSGQSEFSISRQDWEKVIELDLLLTSQSSKRLEFVGLEFVTSTAQPPQVTTRKRKIKYYTCHFFHFEVWEEGVILLLNLNRSLEQALTKRLLPMLVTQSPESN